MWVTTIDERTCPLCMSLHGQTWDINEVDLIPDIPDGTHYNCRCRVMLVESQFAADVALQQAT
jgi:SPP1 gp7 family putative phage head morphogenesis protein